MVKGTINKVKRIIKFLFLGTLLVTAGIMASYRLVQFSTSKQLYSSIQEIPHNKVGLLLGTSKYLQSGNINLYYKYRIEAAVTLYEAGKIDFILISGDNGTKQYNEPATMRKDLIAKGIPADKIYLDYAGFRTLDSIIRCKSVFGQESITVISQKFHNERAVFIANRKDIEAIGYNAQSVSKYYGAKTQARERLARVKVLLDLIFNKEPKFLGDPVHIH